MEIVVTGGTGFVGRELVRQLVAAGHRVRLLQRRGPVSSRADAASAVVQTVTSLADASQVAPAAAGADAIIHLVGIISECGDQTFDRVHRGLTATLVRAAQTAGVRRFLQMSALGTRANAASGYHRSKWAAEEVVRGSGLDWTVFRPSLIYGREDHFTNLFARLARWLPVLPVMGPGNRFMQPIAVECVAQAFVAALSRAETVGQTYDLCGPERLTFRAILGEILQATGRRRRLVSIPLPLARVQASILETFYPAFLRRPRRSTATNS